MRSRAMWWQFVDVHVKQQSWMHLEYMSIIMLYSYLIELYNTMLQIFAKKPIMIFYIMFTALIFFGWVMVCESKTFPEYKLLDKNNVQYRILNRVLCNTMLCYSTVLQYCIQYCIPYCIQYRTVNTVLCNHGFQISQSPLKKMTIPTGIHAVGIFLKTIQSHIFTPTP